MSDAEGKNLSNKSKALINVSTALKLKLNCNILFHNYNIFSPSNIKLLSQHTTHKERIVYKKLFPIIILEQEK